MAEAESGTRIKYALHHATWDVEAADVAELKRTAQRVPPADYEPHMDGNLFCPGCFTNVVRTPKDKPLFVNGRKACFAHLPSNKHVPCDLRSTKPEGKLYATEELAKQAIAQEDLVVVSGFLKDPPDSRDLQAGTYDQSQVEDVAGPLAEVPIARHRGDTFQLPTRLSTVHSICRRFDINLYRYYFFPGASAAVRLLDALVDVSTVETTVDTPQLYFGEIIHSHNAGRTPKPSNVRMTGLRSHPSVKDFYLKDIDAVQAEKGIGDDSKGRIVLFWGAIKVNGIGLCAERLGWGEYALLPARYNSLLVGPASAGAA